VTTRPQARSVLIVIPARGGSKGIPRKNLRSLHGKPLVAYPIETARQSAFNPAILLTSEDAEILSVAEQLGAIPHQRPSELSGDAVTLDAVVHDAWVGATRALGRAFEIVVTLQPTSPLIRPETVDRAIAALLDDPTLDTVLTVVDDTHLRWAGHAGRIVPEYEARLNRQYLPKTYRETGGIFATRSRALSPTDRIGKQVSILVIDGPEGIDIDGVDDWALCEWHLGRRDVLFVVAGNDRIGLGHAHNALAVADALTRHRIRFLVEKGSDLAARTIAARNYEVVEQTLDRLEDDVAALNPNIVINDRLDTSEGYVRALKQGGRLVVNFEDLGPGARLADLVINAIYPEVEALPNHYFGHRFYCPRPEFVVAIPTPVRDRVRSVLITFGGTDPNNLTERVLRLITPAARDANIGIQVILGLGYGHDLADTDTEGVSILRSVGNMATHLRDADVVITSAGRTTFEIACVGTPAIVLAQNDRELTHLFATGHHGFLNLGLASDVRDEAIVAAFEGLIASADRRREMQGLMTVESLNGGLERVRHLIEALATT
jgi:CMP-N-acetylneuraminic acid synthetase/spore coat polysaccharide biosynthesis predicted glycosyltransferase SpsG